ncbi:putative sulfate transporter 4.2-like [Capsicum annuum]|uniref:Angiotensin-converting enzyme 2 n=1 Tax=Capsicum annuum TaxID=4072 RepID=A0A1U8GRE8_CAPAN|nr:uncharacterized protein LOC107871329 [Capsicum annuum]KAF3618853.1 putative sulfate transporter 4.2-like [Capsicum annuum]KAF3624599.1 putative sulfate transporter 4.2-like [Capsicum annuum]PHT62318.1 hypothetical protein T459_33814 [Capsicum annuum]
MGDSPASYIYMVQHLIEKCLIFNMTKEECMEALSKHANIKRVITVTVWNELEKENREFFEAYAKSQNKNHAIEVEVEGGASTMIQKLILDRDHTKNSDNI